MTGLVYIATSLDGFIARVNGALDWLPVPEGEEDFGFGEFMASIDALVMGRNTYEAVRGFDGWAYGSVPVFVLTHRPITEPEDAAANVEAICESPAELVAALAKRGYHRLYIDGGNIIQQFLRAGLIQNIIITRIPVLLGDGIPLFGQLGADIALRCMRTRLLPGGLEQSEYEVLEGHGPSERP